MWPTTVTLLWVTALGWQVLTRCEEGTHSCQGQRHKDGVTIPCVALLFRGSQSRVGNSAGRRRARPPREHPQARSRCSPTTSAKHAVNALISEAKSHLTSFYCEEGGLCLRTSAHAALHPAACRSQGRKEMQQQLKARPADTQGPPLSSSCPWQCDEILRGNEGNPGAYLPTSPKAWTRVPLLSGP